jgi:hypothetical protein
MPNTKVNMILNDAQGWLEWIEVIKLPAIGLEIWEYINPVTAKERLPKFEEPPYHHQLQGRTVIPRAILFVFADKTTFKRAVVQYINDFTRPRWKPDPDIQKRFDTKMERDFRFMRRVEAIRKHEKNGSKDPRHTNKEPSIMREAMYTVGSSYCRLEVPKMASWKLKDSFLRDSSSNSHVYNSRNRFIDFRPAPVKAVLLLSNLNESLTGIVGSLCMM